MFVMEHLFGKQGGKSGFYDMQVFYYNNKNKVVLPSFWGHLHEFFFSI